ncbi:MAG: hypothetical protein KKB51_22555 [Candidatus Riflebacteria bacterium]|nr:hypothetical protein [Candidatus Riflebacteria bacterium]
MKKELYLNLGKDGTCHYGTKSGGDFLYYRNIEKGRSGKVDFFVDLKFEGTQTFSEAVQAIIEDFFNSQKEIGLNQVYDHSSDFGELRILLNESYPHNQDGIVKLIFSKIGSLK